MKKSFLFEGKLTLDTWHAIHKTFSSNQEHKSSWEKNTIFNGIKIKIFVQIQGTLNHKLIMIMNICNWVQEDLL